LLIHAIAQRLKITESHAAKLIEKYIEDIQYRLETGETIIFDSLGVLSKPDASFRFIPSRETEILPEAFGLSPVSVVKNNNEEDIVTVTTKSVNPGYAKAKNKNIKNERFLFVLGVLVILTVAGYFLFLFNHSGTDQYEPKGNPVDTIKPVPVIQKSEDSVSVDLDSVQTIDIENIGTHPGNAFYYLIGGSFKSAQNADNYFSEMQENGYHPIHLGQVGNFYLIALDTFHTNREATRAYIHFEDLNPGKDAWIYHPSE
jgi:hypothetical protein